MAESTTFYCLRCQNRFPVQYDPKEVKERSCPRCGSNSVRKETPAAAETQARSPSVKIG
jgi:DNA-directed RNA polymerase subunit RPC12/RpoP